ARPTHPQPPRNLARYQEISSGRFPDHTIRYWEKLTYAQNMVNAKSIFPRSCRIRPPRNSDSGGRGERRTTVTRARARAPSAWLTMKRTPYIVENQCASSDITQSTDVNVTVRARATRPPPERSCSFRSTLLWSSLTSCSRDHLLRKNAIRSHAPNA